MGCHVGGNGRYMRVIAMMTARRKLPATLFSVRKDTSRKCSQTGRRLIPLPVQWKLNAKIPTSRNYSVSQSDQLFWVFCKPQRCTSLEVSQHPDFPWTRRDRGLVTKVARSTDAFIKRYRHHKCTMDGMSTDVSIRIWS